MKSSSKRRKGNSLSYWVRDQLKVIFLFTDDDIRATIGAENGADVKLSKYAQRKFPYSVECKNQEIFKTIYKYYEQAASHEPHLEPLLIIKGNRRSPLVIIDANYFFNLKDALNENKS
jgi:hypothetical protein